MTVTQTTDLADLLSASAAAVDPPTQQSPAPGGSTDGSETHATTVNEHGEIVPTAAPVLAPAPEPLRPDFSVQAPKVVGGLPYISEYARLAKTVCSTEMTPQSMRGRYDVVLAAFMRGYEMGFGPMQALDSFNVIQGSVGLKPEAMRALIFDNGHQIILSDIYKEDGAIFGIAAKCRRKDWPADQWETYTYTMEDALQAGLASKDNWRKMPRAMLDARATSGAGRRYFADVLAGMSYTPEEIRDFGSSEQEVSPSPTPPSPPPAAESAAPVDTSPSEVPELNTPATTSAPETPSAPTTDSAPGVDASTWVEEAKKATASAKKASAATKKAAKAQTAASPEPLVEMRRALITLTSALPADQKMVCRAFLSQMGYGDPGSLDAAQLDAAIRIAGEWPKAAEDLAAEDEGTLQPPCEDDEDDIEDAEIVPEGEWQLPL